MEIKEILQKVENISSDSKYMFVRTEKGLLFEQCKKKHREFVLNRKVCEF
ncbi:MAG: hypothetical protein ACJA2M_002494 [Polaribacter sp.]|jgi:hypothetical protein